MKINAENIEQWMFDFHEGMLSEPDKAELLNFLHNHPELNAEFGLWAQTHALKNEQVIIPSNLLEGVLKPVSIPFYYNKFVLGTITGLSFSILISGYLYLKPTVKKSKIHTVIKSATPLVIDENNKGSVTTKPNKTIQLNKSLKQTTIQTPTSEEGKFVDIKPDSIVKTRANIELEEVPQVITLLKADSNIIIKESTPVEKTVLKDSEEKPVIPSKKKKNRLPLNVKPQSEFKPANPNF